MYIKLITILVFLYTGFSFAQVGINYSALLKDNNGNVLSDANVDVQFTVEISGIAQYREVHNTTTDQNGIVNLTIGFGSSTLGTYSAINWGFGLVNLNVQVDSGDGFIDLGTTLFKEVPYAIKADRASSAISADNVEGLVYKNEGNGTGWRLRDRGLLSSEGYGSIGLNAIDLSSSDAEGTSLVYPYGATGEYSLATGEFTIANGDHSTAMGSSSRASGNYSTAMGRNTVASGFASTATGRETIASNNYAFASGFQTVASQTYSIAMGSQATALGFASIALGYQLNAEAAYTTVIGRNNIGGGDPFSWNDSDPLFEIGNGISESNRSNAMTVLKNGNTGIGTDSPQERLHVANGRLRIGTETIEDTGSNLLSFNASLIPDGDNLMRLGNASNRWVGVWAVDGTINTSDRREKKNIKELTYGLDEILKMNPVSFNWRSGVNSDVKLGLIAQDLQELIPEVVKSHAWEQDEITGEITKKELERMGVYYSDLVPVLINAIKQQHQLIETLQKENAEQKLKFSSKSTATDSELNILMTKINTLASKIETLEAIRGK